jgi:hypothetical protein
MKNLRFVDLITIDQIGSTRKSASKSHVLTYSDNETWILRQTLTFAPVSVSGRANLGVSITLKRALI